MENEKEPSSEEFYRTAANNAAFLIERKFFFRAFSNSRRLYSLGAPNNYRIDRVSGDPSVIARSPCDEAIQGPQHARRQQPRRSYCGPWIAHMGILASMVDFSFSCRGFFDVAGAGFRRAESAVELMEARFSGGSGLSRGEARRRRRAWRALDGPEPPEVLRT